MLEKIKETVEFLNEKGIVNPYAGIVLGTGLGGLTSKIENKIEIDYHNIPNFPVSTVKGHHGTLIFGDLGEKKVVAMNGRFHYYEGYSADTIAFPIRVLKYLGIKLLMLSNAAGGVNRSFNIGDIMIITDHINFLPNPLLGPNDERIGPRFPDMSETYDKKLIDLALKIADSKNIKVRTGVYISTSGPTFETPAEYKSFRLLGADAVGMSTTPEVIIARHAGVPCFAVSIITDMGVEGRIQFTTHESVIQEAAKSEGYMTSIITEMIKSL